MINHFANPFEVLKAKSQQAWSGCIEIAEPKDNSVSWQIYLFQGRVQYATSTAGNQERLNYLWQQFKLGSDCPQVTAAKEYEQICQWCEDRQGTDINSTELILKLTREAINQIFSIEKTKIELNNNCCLSQNISNFLIRDLADIETINRWKQIRQYIINPFVKLKIQQENHFTFYKLWIKQKSIRDSQFNKFAKNWNVSQIVDYCLQKLVFYKFASLLDVDIFSLAEYFKEFIESEIIEIQPFAEVNSIQNKNPHILDRRILAQKKLGIDNNKSKTQQEDSRPVIACIDDSKTVHKQVNLTLEAMGYRAINITDPQLALKSLFKEKPVLILMDINMPTINGYELCKRLKGSNKFSTIPVVMLTGRDGIIDRMRANFVGASDYLTKPFQPNSLIEMVQKYVSPTTSV